MPILGSSASGAKSSPVAPTIGTATDVGTSRAYNNGAATVTFTAPNSKLPITSYTVTSSPGGYTGTGASSPITVAGLQSATAYTFTVTATSAAGISLASSASNSITATTVPQAPTIGTATAGNASATVTYTAGATGGKAVSAYTATSSPSSITGTGASPITVSGLSNGTGYTFTVTATNANGTSTASSASNSITPVSPPGTSWTSVATTVSGTGAQYSTPTVYSMAQISNNYQAAGATSNGYDMAAWGSGSSTAAPTSWTYTMGPYSNSNSGTVDVANGVMFRYFQTATYFNFTTSPGQNPQNWSNSGANRLAFPGFGPWVRWDGSQYVTMPIYNGSNPYYNVWTSNTTGTSVATDITSAISLPAGANMGLTRYFGNYYYVSTDNGTTTNYLYYRNGLAATGWTAVSTPTSYEYKQASTSCMIRMRSGQTTYQYTTDGTTWNTGTFPTTTSYTMNTRASESSYVFARGTNGVMYYTTNGSTWTSTNLPSAYHGQVFVYNGSMWAVNPSQLQNSSGVAQAFYQSTN